MSSSSRRQIKKTLEKLFKSGWQSWSTTAHSWLKFPRYNFAPSLSVPVFPKKIKLEPKNKKPAYGWCSWYLHGTNINEEKILTQAHWMVKNPHRRKLPLEYLLIDDGWNLWGDWLDVDKQKFPRGLKSTVTKIKKLGLKTGVWIAPFLVDPKSRLAREHPDWLVHQDGELVEGHNFSHLDRFLAHKKWLLDIRKKAVRQYLDESLKYLVEDCGFELLKLDFLYAIYFNPHLRIGEADRFLRNYLAKIKKTYPQIYTIACGCPLIPAAGVVDSMRIGPDTKIISPVFGFLDRPFFNRWYLTSQVLPTVAKKLWTKKLWHVDPDAFLCRRSLGFSHRQLLKFQKLIQRGAGNIFLGDDLTRLSSWRIKKYLLPLFDR